MFFTMHILVGLGNPGVEYALSRHSVGRDMILRFLRAEGFDVPKMDSKRTALVSEGKLSKGGERVTLVIPESFMNDSGPVIKRFVKNARDRSRLIVLHDDLDLPLGSIKISFGRGSGGHRGVESVSNALRSKDFTRVRIGISPELKKGGVKKPSGGEKTISYVLGKFSPRERAALGRITKRIREVLISLVSEGTERAMNRFN